MVVVDGRQPGYSVGMTNFELAQALARLGAVTGSALDSGGSTTMAFDGQAAEPAVRPGRRARGQGEPLRLLLRRLRRRRRRAPVISPNGDGVAERQTLCLQGRASLHGDREPRSARTVSPRQPRPAPREPGTYQRAGGARFRGAAEPEGRWHWVVSALDDQGRARRSTAASRLNNTLGYLRVRPTRVVVQRRGGKPGSVSASHIRPS